ncbi:MAG: carboxypeptidase-like regulatory domain-containing protein, partial [Gemmatimonadaceae bacterium]
MSRLGLRWLYFGSLQAAALLLGASSGGAQLVSGRTVLDPTREPAPGVVVELLDSAGDRVVARTFSDGLGRFLLRDVGRGRFVLRAMRIGVRPLRLPIVLGAADTSLVLRMVSVPLSLPPVLARTARSCNTRPDSGLALGTLWNDAESALLAASITRRSPAYDFAVVDYTRDFDFRTRELEAVVFEDVRSTGARAWTSLPASALRRNGFVVVGRDSATFIAPDIETLVSRDFVESHCFALGSHHPASDALIGIDFTPAGSPKHPEVRGTMWLERA